MANSKSDRGAGPSGEGRGGGKFCPILNEIKHKILALLLEVLVRILERHKTPVSVSLAGLRFRNSHSR